MTPILYSGPIGPFIEWEADQDETIVRVLITLALRKTHGIYQRYLVTGWESWQGLTIQGRGNAKYGLYVKGYLRSRQSLLMKLARCGILVTVHHYYQPPDSKKGTHGRTGAFQKCVLTRISYSIGAARPNNIVI